MIRLLLVDDHVILRQGLKAILEQETDLQIVGETTNGLEVVQMVETLRPDIVLLDLMLPGVNGLEIARLIRSRHPATRVIILSMYSTLAYVATALHHGAGGYVLKDAGAEDLIQAIREVAAGRRYLSHPLNEAAIAEYQSRSRETTMDLYEKLTAREREVLSLAAHGLTNIEMGARLHISPRTVEIHRSNLMRKLGLRTRSEMLRFAVARGILLVDYNPAGASVPTRG